MSVLTENQLDVIAEVEAFKPCEVYASCRANAAGTKVIYRTHGGEEQTFWARERKAKPLADGVGGEG